MSRIPDILADSVAKHEAQLAWLSAVREMAKESVWLDGVEISCAYKTFGKYYPATQHSEAEDPDVSIESINLNGNWLSARDTGAWLERLPDLQELLEEIVFEE